ncbi:hypothetical protein [Streptomyces sp. NPDC002082]|uniref:hypothetical protein n=1 Tax=Streptomyces sp. NPDC002082 TaxID=3154772 RepID=UPI00332CFE06
MTYEPESLEQHEAAALLSAALSPPTVDPAAEASATQAFREARDQGLHQAHKTPRRRDDWRPHRSRGLRRWSLRTGAIGIAISTAVGGVALAAVTLPVRESGVPAPRLTDLGPTASPSPSGTVRDDSAGPGTGDGDAPQSPAPSESASSWSPESAGKDAAFCRVFLASLERRGDPPKGEAFDRWLTERGGVNAAADHCAAEANRKAEGQAGRGRGGGGNEGQGQPEHSRKPAGGPADPAAPQPNAEKRPGVSGL